MYYLCGLVKFQTHNFTQTQTHNLFETENVFIGRKLNWNLHISIDITIFEFKLMSIFMSMT